MVAVCDECGARESATGPQAHLRSKLVRDEADDASRREYPQMCQIFGVQKPHGLHTFRVAGGSRFRVDHESHDRRCCSRSALGSAVM